MERRDRSGYTLLIRAAGVGASAVGLTLARYPGHFRPSAETLSFLLMAAGILLAGESETISRWFELDVPEFPEIRVEKGDVGAPLKERRFKPVRRPRTPEPPKERVAARGLAEVALMIASGFAICCMAPPQQSQDGGVVAQLMDAVRHWQPPGQPGPLPPNAGPVVPQGPVMLQLDPGLRDAVMAYVAKATAAQGSSSAGGMSGVELVLLVLIAVAVIVLLLKKPKEAAVVGAAALSGAAIKEADHLSNLGPVLYWFVCVVYLLVSVVALLWLGVLIYERMNRAAAVAAVGGGTPHAPREKKSEGGDPFLAAGVSVVILLWTVVMVGYRHTEAVEKKNTETVNKPVEVKPPVAVSEMLPSTLTATVRFAPGEPQAALHPDAEWAQTAELRDDLNRLAQRGDELLLLGSTDCTSYRSEKSGNNAALARRRADAVFDSVKAAAAAKGVSVQMAPLRQHEACKGSPDQRTVFSILLRPKPQ